MNVDTGEAIRLEKSLRPASERTIKIGDIVEILGSHFRVSAIKPNGRLFLKIVRGKP